MQLSNFFRKTLAPLLASFSLQAAADELPQVYSRNSEKILRGGAPLPLVLQLGIDGGMLSHKTTIPREGPYDGGSLSGKALASFLFDDWLLEGGLGWSYSALYGTIKGENPIDPELGQRIYTQSAFAEAGIRVRLTPRFNIGLIAQDYFGTDLSLSQRKGLVSNMLLGGAMAALDLFGESGIFRIGAQLLAEIPDNNRQVLYYGATLQFGIPLKDYDVLLRKTDVLVRRERVQKIEIPKIITKTVVRDVTKYSLPSGAFRFAKAQSALNPDDQEFAVDLAQTLKQQSTHFKFVTIEAAVKASADPRRDQQLSELRAQSIRNAIVSSVQIPTTRVLAVGLGGRSNVDDRAAPTGSATLVELSFAGLSNPDAVSDALNLLLKRRSTPETCRGDKCK
jgi:outer membrane protein OmpA-like peptidoglycan-associated protein